MVTAALPYSYAPRHFGHLAGAYLPADIFTRYNRIKGNETLFVCGTDENASSIVLEAIKRGLTPKQLCDQTYPIQKKVFDELGISFNIFSRTSKQIHYDLVWNFYQRLWDKGYVYPKDISQWFCPIDKKVLPDRFVKGICPRCGAPDQYGEVCEVCGSFYEAFELIEPRCSLCGAKPEIITKKHYFLRLSALTEKVLGYVRDKTYWRKATYNKTISWLEKEGLKDKDITRDYEWGPPAPFPDAEGQVLYNWVENLLGYISASIDWAQSIGKPDAWKKFWLDPQTRLYCFIGKDNLFFHTILFPAILIAHGDYILPHNVVVNEFVNLEGQKISTSRGWVVWLHDMLKHYHPDMIRYYAVAIAPEGRDTDFKWRDFQARINGELIGNFANYIHRVLTLTWNMFNGEVPEPDKDNIDEKRIEDIIRQSSSEVAENIERCEFRDAMKKVIELAQEGNKYLNEREPWKNKDTAPTTIYNALRIVNALSVVAYPFLPFSSTKIREYLGLGEVMSWSQVYERVEPGGKIREPKPLFRKVVDAEVDERVRELNNTLLQP